KGKKVMVQLHGEKAPRLIKFLEDRGAHVFKVLPYQHIAPNSEIVKKLCNELMNNEIDAVCFTTTIQVRSLFDFAKEHDYYQEIRQVFKEQVVAVAVGKVTAEALKEEEIQRIIVPEKERMGAMIIELSRFYAN
ncbi:uroporphyrinogen-III synthase, partial [Priestia megaterium]